MTHRLIRLGQAKALTLASDVMLIPEDGTDRHYSPV